MPNTRQTHPWVDTDIRCLTRRKQRAQKASRQAETSYLQKVVSEDQDKNPRRFWSYVKSRKQENESVSYLIDQEGFRQSESQKKA
ncbi:hypothetical protein DPMN_102817 [Dreissena polymorpha]|uniref:Uncharacterized protein n=1 Tax=Dreissena polymorpha TaxID=45954 RepID=A0A9D4H4V5_DREPO|nr:hypothetical protein DPMN_102817 [Dreissena polymorpha]